MHCEDANEIFFNQNVVSQIDGKFYTNGLNKLDKTFLKEISS